MLSIVVLNYNRLEYTRQTVQNLIDITTVKHEFIFVDNGSIDGTREYLKSLEYITNAEKVIYVFNDRNLGVAGGRNSGLKHASGDYLMTIDDDIIAPLGYDGYFVEACDKVTKLGITGLNTEGNKVFKIHIINGVKLLIKSKGNLGGGCLCLPRRVFEQVGYYRADFIYGGEDCDMYNRVVSVLGLISGYIVPPALHIDKNTNVRYADLKRRSHKLTSPQYNLMANNANRYKKGSIDVYVPYMEPEETEMVERFDQAIKGHEDGSDS